MILDCHRYRHRWGIRRSVDVVLIHCDGLEDCIRRCRLAAHSLEQLKYLITYVVFMNEQEKCNIPRADLDF